jgi:hypothetical protein
MVKYVTNMGCAYHGLEGLGPLNFEALLEKGNQTFPIFPRKKVNNLALQIANF